MIEKRREGGEWPISEIKKRVGNPKKLMPNHNTFDDHKECSLSLEGSYACFTNTNLPIGSVPWHLFAYAHAYQVS